MKKIFYIIALGIALAGCSNNEDELLSTGSFPEDHVIRVITEVNEPLSRAGYDAMNLERFGLMIRNSENAAYNYHKQMVGSGSAWSTSDGQQMLWDAERTPVTMIAYAPFMSEATPDASLTVNALTNQSTEENVKSSDFLLMLSLIHIFRGAAGFDIFNVHDFYFGLQSMSTNQLTTAYSKNAHIMTGKNVICLLYTSRCV